MKKKRMLGYWSEKIPYERVLRVMRLMFLLTVCIVCQLSAESLAQTVKLKEQTLKLKSIFEQVEAQTGKFTLFSNNELDMNRAVKLDRREFTLEELYRLLLRDTKLEFEITRDYVVIRPGREVARDSVRKLIQVSGVVRDERHNPLPGVTVLVKELKVGSATNVKRQVRGRGPFGAVYAGVFFYRDGDEGNRLCRERYYKCRTERGGRGDRRGGGERVVHAEPEQLHGFRDDESSRKKSCGCLKRICYRLLPC